MTKKLAGGQVVLSSETARIGTRAHSMADDDIRAEVEQLRAENAALQAAAELGRAVAAMPENSKLWHANADGWFYADDRGTMHYAHLPLEVLRKSTGYRAARGVLPLADGAPASEDVIREGRDAE